jgi:hypothetical protein
MAQGIPYSLAVILEANQSGFAEGSRLGRFLAT